MDSVLPETSDVISRGNIAVVFIASQDEPKGGRMGSNLIHLVTLEERHETMPSRKNMV